MSASSWQPVALGEVLTARRDAVDVSAKSEYPNFGLFSFGRGVFAKPPIRGDTTSASTLFQVQAGQFIYSRLFAFEGAFATVPAEVDGWYVSNEYPTFDIDSRRVLSEFLRLTICRPAVWKELADMTVGMGHRRQRLQPDALLAYEVSLPSLEEQKSIVAAVYTVDVALQCANELRTRAVAFLHALREARLVDNGGWRSSPGWKRVQLADLCDVSLGFTKGRKLVGETRPLPYLRAVNVQEGFIILDDIAQIEACDADLARYALQTDDILLLEGGNTEHVGRAWIWDGSCEPCLHQNSTLRARVRSASACHPRFVAWALGASPARAFCFEEANQTSNVAHLGLAGALSIPLPAPPISDQFAIVEELDIARAQLVAAERKLRSYQRVRSALVEGLVTGHMAVRDGNAVASATAVEGLAV